MNRPAFTPTLEQIAGYKATLSPERIRVIEEMRARNTPGQYSNTTAQQVYQDPSARMAQNSPMNARAMQTMIEKVKAVMGAVPGYASGLLGAGGQVDNPAQAALAPATPHVNTSESAPRSKPTHKSNKNTPGLSPVFGQDMSGLMPPAPTPGGTIPVTPMGGMTSGRGGSSASWEDALTPGNGVGGLTPPVQFGGGSAGNPAPSWSEEIIKKLFGGNGQVPAYQPPPGKTTYF